MIISHKYKYLFVELPHTASTAISKELTEHYDGQKIIRKHAYYHEFLKIATPEEKKFFVFSGIRNPLDVIITPYFKYKSNHEDVYTTPKLWKRNGGFVPNSALTKFNFVQTTNADFPTFFKKFYYLPYDDWSCLAHHQFDFIIRFENLQSDFATLLSLLKIEQVRDLPLANKTPDKKGDFWTYYIPEIRDLARNVGGPYMKKWGYKFPNNWKNKTVPWYSQTTYKLVSFVRGLKWRYVG